MILVLTGSTVAIWREELSANHTHLLVLLLCLADLLASLKIGSLSEAIRRHSGRF